MRGLLGRTGYVSIRVGGEAARAPPYQASVLHPLVHAGADVVVCLCLPWHLAKRESGRQLALVICHGRSAKAE